MEFNSMTNRQAPYTDKAMRYTQTAIEDAHTTTAQEGRTMHCPQDDATSHQKEVGS